MRSGTSCFSGDRSSKKSAGTKKVKHQATEDVKMARVVKKHGGKIVFADLRDMVDCRMYTTYKGAIRGIAKNAYDYLGKNLIILFLGTVAVPLIFFIPVIVCFVNIPSLGPALPFLKASAILSFYTWALETIDRRLPWYVAFIYPLIFVNTLSSSGAASARLNKKAASNGKAEKVK